MADLKELLGEELGTQVQGILEEKKVNFIVDDKEAPSYIPKNRFDEVIGSKNQLKSQVGELSSELESLKKSAKGNEELTQAIQDLQNKNSEWEGKYQNNLIDNAIKMTALSLKFNDPDDAHKFIDKSGLTVGDDGNVEGVVDLLKTLKENKPYLALVEKQANNNSPTNPVNVVVTKDLNEQWQEAVKNGNQPLAIALKNKMYNI